MNRNSLFGFLLGASIVLICWVMTTIGVQLWKEHRERQDLTGHTSYFLTNRIEHQTNVVIQIPGRYMIRWTVEAP